MMAAKGFHCRVFLTLVSVFTAWLAFPPHSFVAAGFFAYWPLMVALDGAGVKRAMILSVLWGWSAAALGLWSFTSVWGGGLFLAVVSVPGILTAVKVFLAWAAGGRGGSGALGWPLAWALADHAWLWAGPVLPFAIAGYPLTDWAASRDLLWTFGVPGGSFVVMAVNRGLYLGFSNRGQSAAPVTADKVAPFWAQPVSGVATVLVPAISVLAVMALSFTAGLLRPPGDRGAKFETVSLARAAVDTAALNMTPVSRDGSRELGVVLLQGCIDQERKSRIDYRTRIISIYLNLAARGCDALRQSTGRDDFPVLAVWPETSTPGILRSAPADFDEISRFCRQRGVSMILGTRDFGPPSGSNGGLPEGNPAAGDDGDGSDRDRVFFNSAVLIGPDGSWRQTYDKVIPATFAETGPYTGFLSFLNGLRVIDHRVEAGPGPVVFRVPCLGGTMGFGTLICYESLFPALVARNMEAGAEVMLNLSNDAWFHGTAEPDHLVQETLARAFSLGITVLRASNTGVSFAAGSRGIAASIGLLERGYIAGIVKIAPGASGPAVAVAAEPAGLAGGSPWFLWHGWAAMAAAALLLAVVIREYRMGRTGENG